MSGQLRPEVGLRDRVLDVLAHVVERLDLGVDREALELLWMRMRACADCHLGQHGVLLGLELLNLALHAA